jgi:uncharacterized membrane protein YadS
MTTPSLPDAAPVDLASAHARTRAKRQGPVSSPSPTDRRWSKAPGMILAAGVAAVATAVVGAPVVAIVVGIAIAALRPVPARLTPGLGFTSKVVLQGSIVVLGLNLSAAEVLRSGRSSLPVLLGTLALALAAAAVVGRLLRLRGDLTLLIGVGTAICGASAIAATDAVIDADEADVSYAIATIFTFNVVAVLAYPALGHALGLSQHAFGLWSGTAINDMSSVVAASTVYGHGALSYGVVVKLTRTLAIIPICVALAAWRSRRRSPAGRPVPAGRPIPAGRPVPAGRPSRAQDGVGSGRARRPAWWRVLPAFIPVFVVAVGLNSVGLVPGGARTGISDLATWMITAAMAAIGLSTRPRAIRTAGARPLVLGACLWAAVGIGSLTLQAITGQI